MDLEDDDHTAEADMQLFTTPGFPITRKWLLAQWKITSIILQAYEDILNNIVQQYIKKASKVSVKIGQMHEYSKMCRVILRFVSEEDAEHAAKVFHNLQINGKNIDVFHMERDADQLESLPDEDSPALIVSGFRKDLTSEEVRALFPTARIVTMVKDRDGKPQGAARLEYKTIALARTASQENKDLKIDEQKVSVHFLRKLLPPGGVKTAPKRKTGVVAGKDSGGATVEKRRQIATSMGGRGRATMRSISGRGKNTTHSVQGSGTSTYGGGRGRGTGSSDGWATVPYGSGMGSGFQGSGQGGHDLERLPDLMNDGRFTADRYRSYDNYNEGFERYGHGQDFGDGFRGDRMGCDFNRMGGDLERMGGRGTANEIANLGMERESGTNLGGLDVNAAAPLILGLAKKLAEQMTAGKGSQNVGADNGGGGGGAGMRTPFVGDREPGPSFHFGEGTTKYVRDGLSAGRGPSRFSNSEEYTGGYTHQGLERHGIDDLGRGADGLGQQNGFGQRSGFGLEGHGFNQNNSGDYSEFDRKGAGRVSGSGSGFGSSGSGFGGSGSRLGSSGSGFGGSGSRLGSSGSGFGGSGSGFGGSGSRLGSSGSGFGYSGSRLGGFGDSGSGLGGGRSGLGRFGGSGSRHGDSGAGLGSSGLGFGSSGSRLGGGSGGFGGSGSRLGAIGSRFAAGSGLGDSGSGLGGFGGGGSGSRLGYDRGDGAESRFGFGDHGSNRGSGFNKNCTGYGRSEASGFGRDLGGGWGMGKSVGRY